MGGGGWWWWWWANPLQTLSQGLVLTLRFTIGPELDNKSNKCLLFYEDIIFKVKRGSKSQSSFAKVVQSAVTIQRAYRIYKKRKSAGLIKKRKPLRKPSITKQAKVRTQLDQGSIRSSLRDGLSTAYRLTENSGWWWYTGF